MINKAEVMATYGLSGEEFDTLLFDFQEMDVDGCVAQPNVCISYFSLVCS